MALEFNGNKESNSAPAGVEMIAEENTTAPAGVDDDTLNCCFQVMEAVSRLNPEQSQVLWCMVTDYVAAKNGIPAREIINTLVPLVVDVNEMMGPFDYDSYPPAPDALAFPAPGSSKSSTPTDNGQG